jgi:hypothetical protein
MRPWVETPVLKTKKLLRLSSYYKISQIPTEVSKENSEIWSWTHRDRSCPEEAGPLCGCLVIWVKFFLPWTLWPLYPQSPASHSQDYTVENLIHLGMFGLVLVVLGILLSEAQQSRKRTPEAARCWTGESSALLRQMLPGIWVLYSGSGRKSGV